MNQRTLLFGLVLSAVLVLFTGPAFSYSPSITNFYTSMPTAKCTSLSQQTIDLFNPENFLDEQMFDDEVMESPESSPLPSNRNNRGRQFER